MSAAQFQSANSNPSFEDKSKSPTAERTDGVDAPALEAGQAFYDMFKAACHGISRRSELDQLYNATFSSFGSNADQRPEFSKVLFAMARRMRVLRVISGGSIEWNSFDRRPRDDRRPHYDDRRDHGPRDDRRPHYDDRRDHGPRDDRRPHYDDRRDQGPRDDRRPRDDRHPQYDDRRDHGPRDDRRPHYNDRRDHGPRDDRRAHQQRPNYGHNVSDQVPSTHMRSVSLERQ